MARTARRAKISVSFAGMDISDVVNKYLMSMTFTDNEEDEADDLQIKLQDRDGIWLQQWLQDTIDSAGEKYGRVKENEVKVVTISDSRSGIRKTVSKGSSNYDAVICQIYLIATGFLTGEPKTKIDDAVVNAIKAFQKANKLGVDGKCGKKTWKKLTDQANGKVVTLYKITFKATSNVAIRQEPKSSAAKVATIAKGKSCTVDEKVASSWYEVTYDGNTGYVKGSGLKLSAIEPATSKRRTKRLKGLRIRASITSIDTDGKKTKTDCGQFELDDVKASGPPSTVVIKATSLGYKGIRVTENDKSWENMTLKGIAKDIAKKAGLGVLFDAKVNPSYKRIEQTKQTDIAFLKKLCQDCGYSLKIANNQIVIYDQSKYENLEEIARITCGDGSYTKWSLATGEGQVQYDMCEVRYTDPISGKVIKGTAMTDEYKEELEERKDDDKKSDDDEEEPAVLVITDRKVRSQKEAEELAAKQLKLANKFERQATMTVKGNPMYAAGLTMRLYKFGYWTGKYLISRAQHTVSGSGYVTTLTMRKVDEVEKPKKSGKDGGGDGGGKKDSYKVGDVVKFKGGYHYVSSTAKSPVGGKRTAGPAKVTHVTDLSRPHPYGLQGGHYNNLDGDSNVHGWVDADSFE